MTSAQENHMLKTDFVKWLDIISDDTEIYVFNGVENKDVPLSPLLDIDIRKRGETQIIVIDGQRKIGNNTPEGTMSIVTDY